MNKKTHLEPVALLLLTAFQHMALAVADVVLSNISQYNADDNLNKKGLCFSTKSKVTIDTCT